MSKKRSDIAHVNAIRRRHLKALALMRYGPAMLLPNNRQGRNHLVALLACGCDFDSAARMAPFGADELASLIDSIDSRPELWTAERLGNLVELTNEERQRGAFNSLRPIDVQWADVQQQVKQGRRERNREQQRRRRAKVRAVQALAADLDVREESILVAIVGRDWIRTSDLRARIKRGAAWRNLAAESLRRIVNRLLDDLAEQGLIESRIASGHRGIKVRSVRRTDLALTRFCPGTAGTGTKTAEVCAVSADGISISTARKAVSARCGKPVSAQSYTMGADTLTEPQPTRAVSASREAKRTADLGWPFPTWTPPPDQWALPARDIRTLLRFAVEQTYLARSSN